MFQVIKTNGETADFTLTKISDAIMKAFCEADMQYNYDQADLLALRVTADFRTGWRRTAFRRMSFRTV